ncbi:MAG: ATP-binding protein [Candidatus Eisenbacteria bacterium]
MNVALLLALFTATVNLAAAVAHFAISRAPGRASSRTFAWLALSAAAYSIGNIISSESSFPDWAYFLAARGNYAAAGVHILLWYVWVLGGPEARFSHMARPWRVLCAGSLAVVFGFVITGLHLRPESFHITVPWAHVTYHYVRINPAGEALGWYLFALLTIPYAILVRRTLRGDRSLVPLAAGFTVYIACSVVEVMVANGNLVWLSPADIGFLAVIVPTSTRVLQQFIRDAHRLQSLTGQLAGEVRERTFERDRAQSALIESERLAALGRLAAGVGHEINNPLTYLQLALDRVHGHLDRSQAPHDVRRAIEDARDGAWRIQKVVEGLRAYSRRHAERAPLDLREVARNALKVAQPHLRHVAMLETQLLETPLVDGEEPRLVQALVNLLTNAAEAVSSEGANGRIRLCTGVAATGEPFLEVEDDGPGIPAEHLARVTEPYFTTRGPSGGTGLGLFVTSGIVDAHGGRLEFAPVQPHGVRVRLVFPPLAGEATAVPAAPPHAAELPAMEPPERPRLLAVDDEPMLLRLMTQALERGWQVTPSSSGEDALRLLREQQFDAVLCDLMMPGVSGMELAARVAATDPALRARMVFMTGGAITAEAEAFVSRPDVVSVSKPMDLKQLDALLRSRIAPAG